MKAIDDFINHRLTCQNFIHDFSVGALICYHNILNKEVFCVKNSILIPGKTDLLIIYHEHENLKLLGESLKREGRKLRILLPYPSFYLTKPKKQQEIIYQLEKIKEVKGDKRYHSYIKPIRIIENRPDLGIELRDFKAGQSELIELHDEWVKYKLSQPKTYRISFPTARYRNTLQDLEIPTYRKAIYIKGKLYGFIIFSLENQVAFELSFCSLYWKPEFKILNGLNQYIFSYCLIQLEKQKIRFVNSGFSLNKNLKIFKECSQKANSIYKYIYEI